MSRGAISLNSCFKVSVFECEERAKEAEKVIDPGLGKGHSNLPESTFSVLAKFRAKDVNLHQKHYQALTNLGLIQASMTWCYKNRSPDYHWIVDLYSRMGLPVLDGIQQMVCCCCFFFYYKETVRLCMVHFSDFIWLT